MNRLVRRNSRISLGMGLAFLLLAILVACGPGEEPTPVPTPTPPAVVASPTPTQPGVVATPTPTTVAPPTATPTPGEQPLRGGKLLILVAEFNPDWDINITQSNSPAGNPVMAKVYNNLLYNPGKERTECETCSDWHLENNGKTMVFNLIQGIKFHNGKELTSEDVKYSLRKIMGEVDGVAAPKVGNIKEYVESIETPSRYVVRINLIRPSVFVPKLLSVSHAVIYPSGTTREALKEPQGSGPFILKGTVPGSSRRLERNPNYFKPGKPYLDEVEVVTVADASTRVIHFLAGKNGFVEDRSPQYMPYLQKLLSEGKVHNNSIHAAGAAAAYMVNSKPPFDNIKMRKAVNLAIDRKAWGKIVGEGLPTWPHLLDYAEDMEFGIPDSQIWDIVPGWGTGARKQQEIEQAKQLVKDAGYPNGLDIKQMARTPISVSGGAEFLQQLLGVVGIRTTLDLVTGPQHNEAMSNLTYFIQAYTYAVPTRDPDDWVGGYWITGGTRNFVGYSNREVDRLFPLMSAELDPAKRKALFFQIRDIIVLQDVAYAPYPLNDRIVWWWDWLGGVSPGRDGYVHASSGLHRGDTLWIRK